MPNQTPKTENIYFPDGCQVAIKRPTDPSYFDVGAIQTAVTGVLNWDENQINTANAGKTKKQIKNMSIAGGFTLINLNPEGVERMGGGVFERVTTTSAPVVGVDNQTIADGSWLEKVLVPLVTVETASGNTLKPSVVPTITSVTGGTDGALSVDDDYFLIADSNSPSGFSIMLALSGATLTTESQDIVIVYASVTPIASEIIYGGASTALLTAYAMKITHTDDNAKIRQLELFSVDPNSGGFAFNFKGANEDGLEEMPLTYAAKIDTSLTNNRQLFAWTVQDGAQ